MAKLPKDVLIHLTYQKNDDDGDGDTTTGALLSEPKLQQNLSGRKKMICIYCSVKRSPL